MFPAARYQNLWIRSDGLMVLSGLEELVLSEISSPSRTQQTGDSSSVSSFSYKDVMKEAQPTNQNTVSKLAFLQLIVKTLLSPVSRSKVIQTLCYNFLFL